MKKQKAVVLTDAQRDRFKRAVYREYNVIAGDVGWLDSTPSKAVFVDVMTDQLAQGALYAQPPLTKDERELWFSLSHAQRKSIILAVGP